MPHLTLLDAFAHGDAPAYSTIPGLFTCRTRSVSFWNLATTRTTKQRLDRLVRLLLAKRLEVVGAMSKSGVDILAGSDTPNPGVFPGFALHDELSFLVKSGSRSIAGPANRSTINPAPLLRLGK